MQKSSTTAAEFAAAQKLYCDLMVQGQGHVAAIEATGLSATQAAWAWYADPRNPQHVKGNSVKLPTVPSSKEQGYEVAARRAGLIIGELRTGDHSSHPGRELSWGQIAIVCGVPESTIRRYFKATGLDSAGMRKGKGGRFLADQDLYYTGNRKGIGVQDANPRRLDPVALQKTKDEVTNVLPTKVEALRAELAGAVQKRAAAKKQPARKTVAAKK